MKAIQAPAVAGAPQTLGSERRSELTLRGLRVFAALAETGSVAMAAARLGASSSGVSQHITALEAAVGARLFDRRAKPIALTPAGQVLSAHAYRILSVVSEAETALAEISLASLPTLNLAIIDDLDTSLTPVIVSVLQARFPRCYVNAFSGRSDEVVNRFLAREADIAVSARTPPNPAAFQIVPILREPFVLVAARGSLVPGGDVLARLAALPFVQYSEAIPIGQTIAAHLRRVRFSPERSFSFEATRSVLAMVVQTGGWTITTPLNLLDGERFHDAVDVLPLPFAGLSRRVQLIARPDELGALPGDLAQACRAMVSERLVPRFARMAPAVLAGLIEVEAD
jgi:DNA-binding transcriptional LysR family regulator